MRHKTRNKWFATQANNKNLCRIHSCYDYYYESCLWYKIMNMTDQMQLLMQLHLHIYDRNENKNHTKNNSNVRMCMKMNGEKK